MKDKDIYSATGLTAYIQEVGFLPLLSSSVFGFSAEEVVSDDCGYVVFPDGGWGWSLLTTPETLFGREACMTDNTPEESYQRLAEHFRKILPDATDKQIRKLIG